MKSKLTSFTAKKSNGQHETFTGKYGTMYKFIVAFENGDEGVALSTKQIPNWNIGREYTYEKSISQYGTNIKQMKEIKNYTPSSKQRSPETSKRIMNQTCVYAVNSIMTKIDEEYKDVYLKFKNYVYKQAFENNVDEITAQFSIKASADYFSKAQVEKVSSDTVIAFASKLVTIVNDTAWNLQSMSTNESQKTPQKEYPETQEKITTSQNQPPKEETDVNFPGSPFAV